MHSQKKLTKKQRRLLREQTNASDNNLKIKTLTPLTRNQQLAFQSYSKGKHLMLHGTAGSGKTLCAVYLALKDVLDGVYDKAIIIRSVVPSRDIGFLPGDQEAKIKVYETPYVQLCKELFNRSDAYKLLQHRQSLEFISTSFIRGLTISNSVVIVDECQNMNWGELSTVMTRIGTNCKVLICGDTKQSDLSERDGKQDLLKLINVLKRLKTFEFVQMTSEDIVRGEFCKNFIVECEKLDY